MHLINFINIFSIFERKLCIASTPNSESSNKNGSSFRDQTYEELINEVQQFLYCNQSDMSET